MSRRSRQRFGQAKEYSDANVRATLTRIFEDLPRAGPLSIPAHETVAQRALAGLVNEGCDANIVLQCSFAYAAFQYSLEMNRKVESGTRPEDRKLAFTGGLWRRKDARRIAGACRQLATEIERFLFFARAPGEQLRGSVEVILFHEKLPRVLNRFADFAEDIGERTALVNELPAQRGRVLADLEDHVRNRTGKPHYEDLLAIIMAFRERFPFEDPLSQDALRKQAVRETTSEWALRSLTDRDQFSGQE